MAPAKSRKCLAIRGFRLSRCGARMLRCSSPFRTARSRVCDTAIITRNTVWNNSIRHAPHACVRSEAHKLRPGGSSFDATSLFCTSVGRDFSTDRHGGRLQSRLGSGRGHLLRPVPSSAIPLTTGTNGASPWTTASDSMIRSVRTNPYPTATPGSTSRPAVSTRSHSTSWGSRARRPGPTGPVRRCWSWLWRPFGRTIVLDGEQLVFSRIRFRVDSVPVPAAR